MGATLPKAKSPFKCILDNWDQFDSQSLKKQQQLILFCSMVWPQYLLQSGESWPPEGRGMVNGVKSPMCMLSFLYGIILSYVKFVTYVLLATPRDYPHTKDSLRLLPPPIPTGFPQLLGQKRNQGKPKQPRNHRMPQFYPLQTVGGEFGPTKVHAPLKQIKADLEKFSEDLDKYIDILQGQSFELAWKDIINERDATLIVAQEFGDIWYLSQVNDKMMPEERERFPTGQQAVPSTDPHWNPDSKHGYWNRRHLLTCILKGLRQTRKKSMNYPMLATITQGKEENPTAFLEQLWEALRKYTALSPDSIR
ncbi:Natural cytotoxicity triggering receptor 3 ligand 1 [Plecturocebus cupreus]